MFPPPRTNLWTVPNSGSIRFEWAHARFWYCSKNDFLVRGLTCRRRRPSGNVQLVRSWPDDLRWASVGLTCEPLTKKNLLSKTFSKRAGIFLRECPRLPDPCAGPMPAPVCCPAIAAATALRSARLLRICFFPPPGRSIVVKASGAAALMESALVQLSVI